MSWGETLKREHVDDSRIAQGATTQDMTKYHEDTSDIWHLRKEYQISSTALRNRKLSKSQSLDYHSLTKNYGHDNANEKVTSTITNVEEATMTTTTEESNEKNTVEKSNRKATVEIPAQQRTPSLVHRKTDPCPMREFVKVEWSEGKEHADGDLGENIQKNKHKMISEDGENEATDLKSKILTEERFFNISSYELAKRRLSLPLSTLSTVEHSWNRSTVMYEDSADSSDNVSLETPVKSLHRPSCIKQLHHSPMERRRRQSAWTQRTTSTDAGMEINKPLSKRRMSELPALSALATRRRSIPHTLSLPLGLRRKASRAANSSDYQMKAKNEMLATLSMSSWSENISLKHSDITRRKSCYTGFGVMALKKKEEKRLMVAHEILQTEKNYINALETLNEVFTGPLQNSCVISEKDVRSMFPKQLITMKSGHEKFMKELDERLNNWKWQGVLGDIFAKLGNSYHVDFLTVYSEYVSNFPKSIAIINKYTRNSQKFRRFLEKCTDDPRCERLNISAFLLTPIQRLPRYVLLLRQLAKYTDPNHPDSFHIEIALEKMIDIINILNSSIQNSTRVVRNTSSRRSSGRRRKRNIFRAKEAGHSNVTSPRKSSDDSELSEASIPSTPQAQDLLPLTIDTAVSPNAEKSSDYGSLTNSETPSEPNSPSPSSGSSTRTSNFLKVILRTSNESKKSKRRPLSTTEVEIIRKKDFSQTIPKEELRRSSSRDSIGSIIRNKFGSLRIRRPRSSEENIDTSFERLNDSRAGLFKFFRAASPDNDSFREDDNEITECTKSDSDLLDEKNPEGINAEVLNSERLNSEGLNSGSSLESCTESRDALSCDSDDSTTQPDCRPTSRSDGDIIDNNNRMDHVTKPRCKSVESEEQLTRKKLGKRNSFTNALKYFVPKARSSSSSPEIAIDCPVEAQFSKEKISTV